MQSQCTFPAFPEQSNGAEIRHIPVWPGYAVSNDGTVYSCRPLAGQKTFASSWRTLTHIKDSLGRCRVTLVGNGRKQNIRVHRLVMLVFVGPCPKGMQVCHNNGNPSDNRICNLRYDTCKSNALDRHQHGTMKSGSQCNLAALKECDVIAIRELHASGKATMKQLASRFNTYYTNIWKIINRESWKHITP